MFIYLFFLTFFMLSPTEKVGLAFCAAGTLIYADLRLQAYEHLHYHKTPHAALVAAQRNTDFSGLSTTTLACFPPLAYVPSLSKDQLRPLPPSDERILLQKDLSSLCQGIGLGLIVVLPFCRRRKH